MPWLNSTVIVLSAFSALSLSIPVQSMAQTATPANQGWARCAVENGLCNVRYVANVRFGLPGRWVYRTTTGGIACTNGAFGSDPAPGRGKVCEVQQSARDSESAQPQILQPSPQSLQHQLADAFAAYNRGDFSTAASLLRPLADQGNANAQSSLGTLYAQGQGVPKDLYYAARLYRQAADQGFAAGQNALGVLYYKGEGVPKDLDEASKWIRKAAEQNLAAAQNNLGHMYASGAGAPIDTDEAKKWFRKAAEQGLKEAQVELENIENTDRERQIVERQKELAQKQVALETAEKERQLADRERQLAERERQIAEMRAAQEQAEKNRQIAAHEKQVKEQQEAERFRIIVATVTGVLALAGAAGLAMFWMYRRANKEIAIGHETSAHITTVSSVLTERSKTLAGKLHRWIGSLSSSTQDLSSRGTKAGFALAEKSKALVSEFGRRVDTITGHLPTTQTAASLYALSDHDDSRSLGCSDRLKSDNPIATAHVANIAAISAVALELIKLSIAGSTLSQLGGIGADAGIAALVLFVPPFLIGSWILALLHGTGLRRLACYSNTAIPKLRSRFGLQVVSCFMMGAVLDLLWMTASKLSSPTTAPGVFAQLKGWITFCGIAWLAAYVCSTGFFTWAWYRLSWKAAMRSLQFAFAAVLFMAVLGTISLIVSLDYAASAGLSSTKEIIQREGTSTPTAPQAAFNAQSCINSCTEGYKRCMANSTRAGKSGCAPTVDACIAVCSRENECTVTRGISPAQAIKKGC